MFDITNIDFVEIDHEKVNKKDKSMAYQKYIDKYNKDLTAMQTESVRIVRGYLDDFKIALLTVKPLDQIILTNMIETVDPNMQIEKIEKQWLRFNLNTNINDDNINEGTFEWYIKLKEKNDKYVNLSAIMSIQHFGGFNSKKLYINIIVDGKLYDRVYLDELNEDILYAYAKRYQFTLKNYNIMNIKNNNIIFR